MANILRPYQVKAVVEARERWITAPESRILIAAPTGAGKTVAIEDLLRDARRPVVLVHTKPLMEQTKERIPWAHVAMIQTAIHPGTRGQMTREKISRADMACVDETHHIVSDEFRKVVDILKGVRLFGVSATPIRADKTPLGDVYDHLIQMGKYSQLIADGFLCPCDVWKPTIDRKEQARRKLKVDGVAAYLENAKDSDGRWRPGIYFEPTKPGCEEAAKRFEEAGVRAAVIVAGTGAPDRRRIIRSYKAGDLDIICSPMVLAEGFDAPRAEVCVLARSCDHVGLFLQCVGRVLRAYPTKKRALLIDCTDACSLHGMPTDDRVYSLGESCLLTEEESEAREIVQMESEGRRLIEAEFQFVADTMQARYAALVEQAQERGYKPAWAGYRMSDTTGIQTPKSFFAKSRSICLECRHRVVLKEPIFWTGPQQVYHPQCWFNKQAREEPTARQWAAKVSQ